MSTFFFILLIVYLIGIIATLLLRGDQVMGGWGQKLAGAALWPGVVFFLVRDWRKPKQ